MLWSAAPDNGGRPGWNRVLCQLLAGGMVAAVTSSCTTMALWKATDPQEYVLVSQSEVSESELQDRGVDYRKNDEQGLYYVEKTNLRRLGDYGVRALVMPASVILDAATVIVVVGAIVGPEICRTGACK